jgi:hypothetical protein
MALACNGEDMSTNSTLQTGVTGDRGGNGVAGGTIHHEFNVLEIL